MSVLTDKNVLIVGEENSQLFNLAESLEAHGVVIHKAACEKVSTNLIAELNIDLIIINYLQHEASCADTMGLIRTTLVERAIPVFVFVPDTPEAIQEVLTLGAADYLTAEEDISSITMKIKAVFGDSLAFCGGTSIDISSPEVSVSAAGVRVFVVEDDPLLRNLLAMKMDKSQFPYEFNNDGINVLPAMRQFKPDVVILDLMLPGRSGFEVLSEIKEDSMLHSVPVIIFSNRDSQEDRQKATELGARGFYVKAMTDLSELIETIESLTK